MICVFIRSLKKGGSEKQSIILACALNKKYSTMLVVLHGEYIDEEYLKIISDENLIFIRLKGSLINKTKELYYLLRRNGVRFIFCYLLSDNILGSIIGKLAGTKYVIGGVRSSHIPFWKLLLMKIAHHLFQNYTIFNNESGRDQFVKKYYFNPLKSIVIHNCYLNVPPGIIRNETDIVKILTVGRFVKLKDFDTALESIYYLQKNNPAKRFKYVIVGYGKLEKHIREIVEKLNLKGIVDIVINPKGIFSYFESSDIYLSTSIYEGLSNSIMEAMACSLPVVATNIGDNHFLVKDGLNGFLAEKGDSKIISEKLAKLIGSGTLRNRMGEYSYKHLSEDFTIDNFSENYFRLIESLEKGLKYN